MTSIQHLIDRAKDQLQNQPDALLEAHYLVQASTGLSRTQIMTWPEKEVSPAQVQVFDKMLKRRLLGEPLALILGTKEFWSLTFNVTQDTLIPRPETEILVEQVIEKAPKDAKILDLGTGSGCIAISLKKERPDCMVFASDISQKALSVAATNALAHHVEIFFIHSDLFSDIHQAFDIIVSNPPYIAEDDPHLKDLQYEPQSALISPENGLAHIQQIIQLSPQFLQVKGRLLLEHGATQANDIQSLMQKHHFKHVQTLVDYQALPRVTLGQRAD